ncbi:hypothetical protein ACJJTC_019840 [Scirpophaga incertulas]
MFVFVLLVGLVASALGQDATSQVIGCKGDPNASLSDCPSPCPATCDKPNPQACIAMCEAPGCVCNPGYLLSEGKCVKPTNCPGAVQPEQCGYNEVYTEAKRTCPPQVCEALYLNYLCSADDQPKPGCVCIDGHLRNSSGVCIPVLECPRDGAPVVVDLCGPNASRTDCTSNCPPTCERQNPICILSCGPPGCQCNPGYVRDSQGNCILPENCPENSSPCPDPNAEYRQCASACTPTCKNRSPICTQQCLSPRCQCKRGYVLDNGKCILPSSCPVDRRCPDPNAEYRQCASACTPTCKNRSPICTQQCLSPRCQCKRGYVLDNGKCILPSKCPATQQCPANEIFVQCKSCSGDRCPVNDSRLQLPCLPPNPCPSGCVCKLNHKRNAAGQCIVASDCPPVNCTRPNEVWSPCPSDCQSEYCEAVDQGPVVCNTLVLNCQPRCVCKENYFRRQDDMCVSAAECRTLISSGNV